MQNESIFECFSLYMIYFLFIYFVDKLFNSRYTTKSRLVLLIISILLCYAVKNQAVNYKENNEVSHVSREIIWLLNLSSGTPYMVRKLTTYFWCLPETLLVLTVESRQFLWLQECFKQLSVLVLGVSTSQNFIHPEVLVFIVHARYWLVEL